MASLIFIIKVSTDPFPMPHTPVFGIFYYNGFAVEILYLVSFDLNEKIHASK